MAMHIRGSGGSVEPLKLKPPAVAGLFYPGDAEVLRREVRAHLDAAQPIDTAPPKALIAPHAGYPYSGPVAGTAYAPLRALNGAVSRVVLLGPAHRLPFHGVAVCSAQAFDTPLGAVSVDTEALDLARRFAFVSELDAAFAEEHSLEVHLPFLIETLGDFRLVPLLVGDADPADAGRLIDALWGGPETLIVISSDLSHYLDYDSARERDAATCRAIESFDYGAIGYGDACGRNAVNGLLHLARSRGLEATTVDLRNSGDTAGGRDRVVGYGAWLFVERRDDRLSPGDRRVLLEIATASVRHGIDAGKPLAVKPGDYSARLREFRASFVTLKLEGDLRGCIGSLNANRALVEDVAHNAFAAAFGDKRFNPVEHAELDRLAVGISVLSPAEPLDVASEAALLQVLRPGVDGLVIEEGERRGTFLPAVWESLPEPAEFVRQLKHKAGFEPGYWSGAIRLKRYTAESFS